MLPSRRPGTPVGVEERAPLLVTLPAVRPPEATYELECSAPVVLDPSETGTGRPHQCRASLGLPDRPQPGLKSYSELHGDE